MNELDLVHDIQKVYRKVLDGMSRPGKIQDLSNEEVKVSLDVDCYRNTFLAILMVLDGEVKFNVLDEHNGLKEEIKSLTGAKYSNVYEADYIIATEECNNINEALKKAKVGTLIDPQKSATFFIEVNKLSNDKEYILEGPGIKEKENLTIDSNEEFIYTRNEINKEFPLGIDVILFDKYGKLVCLPRTTVINKEA